MLFAKSVGEVVKTIAQVGISGEDLGISAFTAVGMGLCVYFQLNFLNEGLRYFDVLLLLPVYQGFWITGATANGMIYFEEYINFTALQYIMFCLGCGMVIGGIVVLAMKYQMKKDSASFHGDTSTTGDIELVPTGGADVEKEAPEVRARRLSDTNWREIYVFAAQQSSVNFADPRLAAIARQLEAYAVKVASAGGTHRAAEQVAASWSEKERSELKQSLVQLKANVNAEPVNNP